MKRKNWEIALEELYENESRVYSTLWTHQFIEEETELDEDEAETAVEYLKHMGLIEPEGLGGHELTEKGFEVAHEMSLKKERLKHEKNIAEERDTINSLIAYLTFGLVVVTTLDTIVRATVGLENDWASILFAAFSFFFAVTFYIELTRENFLNEFF